MGGGAWAHWTINFSPLDKEGPGQAGPPTGRTSYFIGLRIWAISQTDHVAHGRDGGKVSVANRRDLAGRAEHARGRQGPRRRHPSIWPRIRTAKVSTAPAPGGEKPTRPPARRVGSVTCARSGLGLLPLLLVLAPEPRRGTSARRFFQARIGLLLRRGLGLLGREMPLVLTHRPPTFLHPSRFQAAARPGSSRTTRGEMPPSPRPRLHALRTRGPAATGRRPSSPCRRARALSLAQGRRQVGTSARTRSGTASGRCLLPPVATTWPRRPRAAEVLRVGQHGDRQVGHPLGLQAMGLAPEGKLDVGLGIAPGATPGGLILTRAPRAISIPRRTVAGVLRRPG